MKLKKLVKESWLQEKKKLTKEEKKAFLEKVRRFNEYGNRAFRSVKLSEISKELAEMCKVAEILTLSEVDESFDSITVERNMKELANTAKMFDKTSQEADILESRMKMLYDDMGKLLERYYEIDDDEELSEELPSQHVEKGQGKKPYDGWRANDIGGQPKDPEQSIFEELPSQKVNKGQGKKPYDNWKANDIGGQPKEPKQSIEEKKKVRKESIEFGGDEPGDNALDVQPGDKVQDYAGNQYFALKVGSLEDLKSYDSSGITDEYPDQTAQGAVVKRNGKTFVFVIGHDGVTKVQ